MKPLPITHAAMIRTILGSVSVAAVLALPAVTVAQTYQFDIPTDSASVITR